MSIIPITGWAPSLNRDYFFFFPSLLPFQEVTSFMYSKDVIQIIAYGILFLSEK